MSVKKIKKRNLFIGILVVFILFLFFTVWYNYKYSMDKTEAFQVNSSNYNRKLIIATQGSGFKDAVTGAVVNHYKKDSIFIKIIDISALSEINPKDFSAILLIHTWEKWEPPIEVETFINNSTDYKSKIIVFTTSGRGSYKMEGVDAITGESKLENTPFFANQIIKRLNPLLKNKMLQN